jgi:hypothetical protein
MARRKSVRPIVFVVQGPVEQVECAFSEFKGENRQCLPAQIAQARFVRYVITDEFADCCGNRKPEDYTAFLYPDVLDNVASYHMEGKTVRPVWVTQKLHPFRTSGRRYSGTVSARVPLILGFILATRCGQVVAYPIGRVPNLCSTFLVNILHCRKKNLTTGFIFTIL